MFYLLICVSQSGNHQAGQSIDVFGVVTNGEAWKFYKLTIDGVGYGTMLYGIQMLLRWGYCAKFYWIVSQHCDERENGIAI